jgi:hypothetical protein
VALNDLDHALDGGGDFITYARYLDDMVVLAPDSDRGRKWADRALERIRREAEAIGVSLNTEKTRVVHMTEAPRGLRVPGLRVSVDTEREDRPMVSASDSSNEEDHRAASIGARRTSSQPAPADAGGRREGERDHPRLGELLSGGQFESGIRQGAVLRRMQRETVCGTQEPAQGIRLEAVA